MREITGLNEKEAKSILQNINWNLESAIEFFFSQDIQPSLSHQSSLKSDLIEALFTKYKNSGSEDIEREGIQTLCEDLNIDPLDPVILAFAYYCKAEVMGIFKKTEFIAGLNALNCDTINKLQLKITELRQSLLDPKFFKQVYVYTFLFSREVGCRNLSLDVAVSLWRLLLGDKFPMVERWIEFLEARQKKHDISKDTWDMLLDFLEIVEKNGIQGYDPDGSWPTLIDEFVEVLR